MNRANKNQDAFYISVRTRHTVQTKLLQVVTLACVTFRFSFPCGVVSISLNAVVT